MSRLKNIADDWDFSKDLNILDRTSLKYGMKRDISPLYMFYVRNWKKLGITGCHSLELGCGSGTQLSILLDENIAQLPEGFDISEGAITGCQKLLDHYGYEEQYHVQVADFKNFVGTAPYDLVIATQFINYMRTLDEFFKGVAPLLSLNSYLVVSDGQKKRQKYSLIQRFKRNTFIRKLLRQKPLAPETSETLITVRSFQQIKDTAQEFGYELVSVQYGKHYLSSLLDQVCFKMSKHNYKSALSRNIANRVYRILTQICIFEEKLLANFNRGNIYFAVFKKSSEIHN
ncbi:class I SAM-dependent methyltransferase [Curvivirga sp.]|uniref:class I SAM-dependent methyltransferase n=1 Tax=Curvivirga sp. TaxID=2856848 RepID=UPI003B5AA8AA